MLSIYLRDWFFNAGIVGFLSIFGETLEEVQENGINIVKAVDKKKNKEHIELDEKILEGFVKKYRLRLITAFLENDLEQSWNRYKKPKLNSENKDKKKSKPDETSLNNLFNAFSDRMELYKYIKGEYTGNNYNNCNHKEAIDLLVKRFLKDFSGENASRYAWKQLERNINLIIYHSNHRGKGKCKFCGQSADENFDTTKSVMNGVGKGTQGEWYNQAMLCSVCTVILLCAVFAFVKIKVYVKTKDNRENENINYYFANHNTSIEEIFKTNKLLQGVTAKLNPIEKIIEIEKERGNKASFMFIKALCEKKLIGNRDNHGYRIQQFHFTPKLTELLSKVPIFKRCENSKNSIKNIHNDMRDKWFGKVLQKTLGYSELEELFQDYLRKKYSVNLGYAVKFVLNFYKYLEESMGKRNNSHVDVAAIGNGKGWAVKQRIQEITRKEGGQNNFDHIAYPLLTTLKTGNMGEFLNIYMRFLMSYKLSPDFPVSILDDKDRFLQYGYAFLAGLLQEDRPAENDKKNNNEVEEE